MAKSNSDKSKKSTAKKKIKQDDLQVKIDELTSSVENEKDQFLRLFAEFENFKKRTAKERIDLFRNAGVEFFEAMLPILDDFDRAVKHTEEVKDINQLQKGFDFNHKVLS